MHRSRPTAASRAAETESPRTNCSGTRARNPADEMRTSCSLRLGWTLDGARMFTALCAHDARNRKAERENRYIGEHNRRPSRRVKIIRRDHAARPAEEAE